MDKVGKLLDVWEEKFKKLVAAGTRSPTSFDTYQRVTRLHIRPAIAEHRIGEATTQRLDKVITKITDNAGASTATRLRRWEAPTWSAGRGRGAGAGMLRESAWLSAGWSSWASFRIG